MCLSDVTTDTPLQVWRLPVAWVPAHQKDVMIGHAFQKTFPTVTSSRCSHRTAS